MNMDIISAFAEGKTIQYKTDTGSWHDLTESEGLPMGTMEEEPNNFRIKPEPKFRPFKDAEECWQEMQKHQPFGWLKSDECFYNIVSVSNIDVSMANVSGDIVTLDFSEVMEDNTFADETPFGIKIEEDYNGIKIDEF